MKRMLLATLLIVAPSANAGVYGDALGKCLVSASSDQDKQQLMKWIFSAISLNPGIAPYTKLPAQERTEIDKTMASLFERLIGESCKKEAAEAIKFEGAAAFGAAFQLLGQVAGQQLFTSPEVSAGAESFYKHVDIQGLQRKLEITPSKP